MDVDGTPVLREGSNGWTCFPDDTGTPASDPLCLDKTWMGWLEALMAGEEPDTQVVGLAYMLSGGSDASNTDPYATGPEEGNEWITTPAHIMVIMPGEIDQSRLLHRSALRWTLDHVGRRHLEHIMMPVDPHGMVEMGEISGMGQAASTA